MKKVTKEDVIGDLSKLMGQPPKKFVVCSDAGFAHHITLAYPKNVVKSLSPTGEIEIKMLLKKYFPTCKTGSIFILEDFEVIKKGNTEEFDVLTLLSGYVTRILRKQFPKLKVSYVHIWSINNFVSVFCGCGWWRRQLSVCKVRDIIKRFTPVSSPIITYAYPTHE